MKVDRDVRKRPSCVCIYCVCASVCVHNVNVFWAYVTLGTTCVWKRDAAVVCDVFLMARTVQQTFTYSLHAHAHTYKDVCKIHDL